MIHYGLGDFVKQLGENARGIVVTQLFPYERSTANPLVREALGLAKAQGEFAAMATAPLVSS